MFYKQPLITLQTFLKTKTYFQYNITIGSSQQLQLFSRLDAYLTLSTSLVLIFFYYIFFTREMEKLNGSSLNLFAAGAYLLKLISPTLWHQAELKSLWNAIFIHIVTCILLFEIGALIPLDVCFEWINLDDIGIGMP